VRAELLLLGVKLTTLSFTSLVSSEGEVGEERKEGIKQPNNCLDL
jgi:hypothetical protein